MPGLPYPAFRMENAEPGGGKPSPYGGKHAEARLLSPSVVPYTLLMPIMKAVELQGEIDDQHRLHADVPQSLPAGSVGVIVLISEEDEGGSAWAAGVSSEWSAELNDPAQDIYTLNDGQPLDAAR